MGKIIPLRDYVDLTGKVSFNFIPPKGDTANFDEHLDAAETLREDAAGHKDKAKENWAKFLRCNRKVNWLNRFTLPCTAISGFGTFAISMLIFRKDVRDTVAALGLTTRTANQMTAIYLVIAALVGVLSAYFAYKILNYEKRHLKIDSEENGRLAQIHLEHAATNEILAAEHIRRAFESTDD